MKLQMGNGPPIFLNGERTQIKRMRRKKVGQTGLRVVVQMTKIQPRTLTGNLLKRVLESHKNRISEMKMLAGLAKINGVALINNLILPIILLAEWDHMPRKVHKTSKRRV